MCQMLDIFLYIPRVFSGSGRSTEVEHWSMNQREFYANYFEGSAIVLTPICIHVFEMSL